VRSPLHDNRRPLLANTGARMPDVLICGGGVIGAATAYFLSKRGARVTILEARDVARGASGYSGGLLSAAKPEHLATPLGPLIEAAYAMHGPLADELAAQGFDYRFGWSPSPTVAQTDAEANALRAGVDGDARFRWLDAAEVRDVSPLADRPLVGGVLGPLTGQLDSYAYTRALVDAARRAGATLRIGRAVGLERVAGRAAGVRLVGGETVTADAVVVAMGPWSAEAASWLGVEVPVSPLKGEILRLRPDADWPAAGFTNPAGDYVMVKNSGLVFTGTTEERAGFDDRPTRAAHDQIRAFGRAYSATLSAMPVAQHTACLRPLSADDLPIIGAVPGLPGAFVATGHGRKGVLLSPITGCAVAELVLDGAAACVDLTPFCLDRFLEPGGTTAPGGRPAGARP